MVVQIMGVTLAHRTSRGHMPLVKRDLVDTQITWVNFMLDGMIEPLDSYI